jgi:hypothetical protein
MIRGECNEYSNIRSLSLDTSVTHISVESSIRGEEERKEKEEGRVFPRVLSDESSRNAGDAIKPDRVLTLSRFTFRADNGVV